VCSVQCAAGSLRQAVCSFHCAEFCVQFSVCGLCGAVGPKVRSLQCAPIGHCLLLSAFFAACRLALVCKVQCAKCSVQSAVCKVQCAKWPVKSAHRRLSGARSLASQPARRGPLSSPGRQPKWAASARPTASIGRLARPVETGTRRGEVRRRAGLVELGDGGDCGGDDCLLLAACCLAGWPAGRLLSGAQVH